MDISHSTTQSQNLPLIASPDAVRLARAVAVRTVTHWGMGHLAENTALVVSELLTNTVEASGLIESPHPWEIKPGHRAELLLRGLPRPGTVLIGVHDRLPGTPIRREPDPLHENGRGLMLVEAASDAWGVISTADGGKVVWCQLAPTSELTPTPAQLPRRVPGATGPRAYVAAASPEGQPDLHHVLGALEGL